MTKKDKDKKISTMITKSGETKISFAGDFNNLIDELKTKKEGIYFAYDEEFFNIIYDLADKHKIEPAVLLYKCLLSGILFLMDTNKFYE